MKIRLVILFLPILLIFTNNTSLSYANSIEDDFNEPAEIKTTDNENNLYKDDEDRYENEIEDDDDIRVIKKIPNLIPTNAKPVLNNRAKPSPTPISINVKPSVSKETSANAQDAAVSNSQTENTKESYNFILELKKLLISLKKIVFNTIS